MTNTPYTPRSDPHELRNRVLMRGRYVRPENSLRPITTQSVLDVLSIPQTPSSDAAPLASAPVAQEQKPTQKRTLFSAILDATVEVDRVTRQSVMTVKHTFEPPHIAALRSHRQKLMVRSFYAVGSLSIIAVMAIGINMLIHAGNSKPVTSVLGAQTALVNDATRNSEMPSEHKPTSEDISTYLVAPEYPRYLKIPSIHVETRIRRLGLDSKGAISTPNNINDAGWYDASVKPGDKDGASIIEGHVAGPTQHGVFWDLNKLVYGDKIEIDKGSGVAIMYSVTKIEKVPANQLDMNKYLASEVSGKHDLKLITAAGKYNNIDGVYNMRLVVYADQLP